MKRKSKAFILSTILLSVMLPIIILAIGQENIGKLSKTKVVQKTRILQIPFTTNMGQSHERVTFYANTFGGTVFITKEGQIIYALPESKSESSTLQNLRAVALKEEILHKKADTIQGEDESGMNMSCFKGEDPSTWRNAIPTYEFINFGEIYDGITLKLKAYGNNIEKLFSMRPNATPELIRIQLSGARSLKINEKGQLEAETDLGIVKFTKPIAYQEIHGKRVEIAVEYSIQKSAVENQRTEFSFLNCRTIDEKRTKRDPYLLPLAPLFDLQLETKNPEFIYGFKVAAYDKTKELIIDPLLASTYLGGSSNDIAYSIKIGADKNIYVAGKTMSTNFPTTIGVYNTSLCNNYDIFIAKLNEDLTKLLAATFLGGSSDDSANSLAIDKNGNVYVAGQTSSSNFPVTPGAFDISKAGFSDAFVAKLSGDLSHLLASTYLGGSYDDSARSLVVDSDGNAYIGGQTSSSNFPVTTSAYDTTYNDNDAFVSKFNENFTHLLASTFLGGSDNDTANSIISNTNGDIYIVGDTWSSNFPITPDAYDSSFNGGFGDVFISKLSGNLTQLLASTFLGGSTDDFANAIIIDSKGDIYITGYTESLDFPTTPGAYDTTFNNSEAFVAKLNGDLSQVLSSTYMGGSGDDYSASIAIDPKGDIFIAGATASSGFPTTPGAYSTSKGVHVDAFISKFNGNLNKLLASTYLGGYYKDYARSVTLDAIGNIYVAGETQSSDFPTTPGAYDTSCNNDVNFFDKYDAFISKFDSNLSASPK